MKVKIVHESFHLNKNKKKTTGSWVPNLPQQHSKPLF